MFNLFVRLFNKSVLSESAAAMAIAPGVPARQTKPGKAGIPAKAARPNRHRPAPPDRPDRKADILLAAEKLFAQHGYHAVSLRQIAVEAGVPLALVGYYYGPKHELFHAIFAHWNSTIEERLQALHTVGLDPLDAATLPGIVEAFIGPVLRLRASSEGEYYALLVARELYHSQAETDRVMRAYFDPLAHAFIDALNAALPHASRTQLAWCYQFALGALLHHISDTRIERLSRNPNAVGDLAASGLLAQFIVGGMRAAVPLPAAAIVKSAARRARQNSAKPNPVKPNPARANPAKPKRKTP